jgi:hypothetical protein
MSSAPANTTPTPEENVDDDEDEASKHTEAFLANLMHEIGGTDTDDGYTSSGDGPIRITANMMYDDDVWLLHSDTTIPETSTEDPRPAVALNPAESHATPPSFPIDSTPLSYLVAFRADLNTLEGIELHETRIYQPGLTPDEIRQNVRLALQTASPAQYMTNFQPKDIPPSNLDPQTHTVLHALLADRDRPNQNTAARNATNRAMFQVYSDSPYLIHANNFFSCCRPHLRNLPPQTAFELQSARIRLEAAEQPPYRPIQLDVLPEPIVPTFNAEKVTGMLMSAPRIQLQPRAQ